MTRLNGSGISVDVPSGWEGRIYTRRRLADQSPPGAPRPQSQAQTMNPDNAVLHLASFAVPPSAGDYGGGAVELMSAKDLFVVVMEHGTESASTSLFAASGIPRLTMDDVATTTLQRLIEGQGGAQKFFHVGNRSFCLYVVFGSYGRRIRTLPLVNQILSSMSID